jgi:hypothetical protein
MGTVMLVPTPNRFSSVLVPYNGLRFSCGLKPAATQMNLFLWFSARQLQTLG